MYLPDINFIWSLPMASHYTYKLNFGNFLCFPVASSGQYQETGKVNWSRIEWVWILVLLYLGQTIESLGCNFFKKQLLSLGVGLSLGLLIYPHDKFSWSYFLRKYTFFKQQEIIWKNIVYSLIPFFNEYILSSYYLPGNWIIWKAKNHQ